MAKTATRVRCGSSAPAPSAPASWQVLRGDALDVLPTLPAGLAQACITSPPYWGLRDYSVRPRVWGGSPDCRHRWEGQKGDRRGRLCTRCSAWKGCLGLEPSPDLYVEHLVLVMREVHRALRPDGTLWLVLGDSFTAHRSYQVPDSIGRDPGVELGATVPAGLKPKDLVGIPWRVAFALQADGWWLRSDMVWAKPNAMPESVRDRPTRAHEFVFLLTKRPQYFYDAEAVREPDHGGRSGAGYRRPERLSYGGRGQGSHWHSGGGRNCRSIWTIPTRPFRGAHFATFPEALVERCVLAGSSPVACSVCGAPWQRVISSRRLLDGTEQVGGSWTTPEREAVSGRALAPTGHGHWRVRVERETIGWQPGCDHEDPGARCTVLDPFAGAGTTGIVAARHGRDFLGIELSGAYTQMARRRIRGAVPTAWEERG